MNNNWAFLQMRSSSDLVGDPDGLAARLAEDGYLYLPGLLDPARVEAVHDRVVDELGDAGWVRRSRDGRALSLIPPLQEGDDAFFDGYDRVQRIEEFHLLAHDSGLAAVMDGALGGPTFPHPLKIARLTFPGNTEFSTPPHQDFPNNQGTPSLTAAWVPLHDVGHELGGIAVLRGSHHFGMLDLAPHWGPGNRYAVIPEHVQEACRWVTTEFQRGDVLVFGSLTVHAALHNASELFMRLSVDFRFQREGEPLTPIVLEPHFQRLTWDEIYAGWDDTEHRYYWHDHDYEVVEFEDFELVDDGRPHQPLAEHMAMERRQKVRSERRERLLAADPER